MKRTALLIGVSALLVGGFALTTAMAQAPAAKRDYDKEMTAQLQKAKDAAGFNWLGTLNRLCILPPSNGAPGTADVAPAYAADPTKAPPRSTWYADPVKIADDFWWLGGSVHSAWVLGDDTNGYFLFDQQYTYNSDELVMQGMKKMGIDVTKVKYHFTSHDHGDHIGAIQMVEKANPAVIDVMGAADVADMKAHPLRDQGATFLPTAHVVALDKPMDFTAGSRTVHVIPTPGHTPGTLSYIFTIMDRGKPVVVAYTGGTAFNFQTDRADPGVKNLQQYIASNQAFADAAAKAHAAMLISNHSEFDMASIKAMASKGRGPNDPNPFVLGEDWTQRYFQVSVACSNYKIIQLEKAAQGAI